jgi:hypothetical protein
MKRNNIIKGFLYLGIVSLSIGCTNLDEEILDGVANKTSGGEKIDATAVLAKAYEGLRDFNGQGTMFAMDEMSTDAMVGPTRGGDWDDNGSWRQLHNHSWGPDHLEVRGAFNQLLSHAYNCNLVIENGGSATEVAQARFLRAWYYYNVVDLFGQAPYRAPGTDLLAEPTVWTRAEATAFIIKELEEVVSALPSRNASDPGVASKDAAHFLLAKLYLNKGVFTAAAPEGPYTFAAADMTKVVQHVDALTNTLETSGDAYWNNFKPENNTSSEVIFSSKNRRGKPDGNTQSRWRMSNHYNQTPGGWNGFSTLGEYYDRFSANDKRIKFTNDSIVKKMGNPAGYQIGQQYAPGGVKPLEDRNGNPLNFTKAVTLVVSGDAIEYAGIRGVKYVPDFENLDQPENDLVLFRYADALLMKAEAIARGGSGSVGTIMSDLASRAGVTAAPATLDGIYAERGRELWWEGWRRNDMIRFNKFLAARQLKPGVSNNKYLLYPIPADALFNSNLKQNPGY